MASLQAIVHREGLRIRILEFHSAPFKGVHLSAVANNQDGATDGQFNYTCPDVTPYSGIYSYQLASSVASNKTWTTCLTIASPESAYVAPFNATQPDASGTAIPWVQERSRIPQRLLLLPSLNLSIPSHPADFLTRSRHHCPKRQPPALSAAQP